MEKTARGQTAYSRAYILTAAVSFTILNSKTSHSSFVQFGHTHTHTHTHTHAHTHTEECGTDETKLAP